MGLALACAGLAYLVWALVAGISREVMQELIRSAFAHPGKMPDLTRVVKIFFVDAGIAIDLVGLGWMAASLVLVALSSRQRISISWAWTCAIVQAFLAALGSVLVSYSAYLPFFMPAAGASDATVMEKVSALSLPVTLALAVLVWLAFLLFLLAERAKVNRRGPTMRDGLKTMYR
ncbi:MAG: hypothetical protein BWX88_01059 [Planctomycetes bacterium ADurb.Bin126]|mgnify:FL=1|nr:MAG: hypothetical protein BWX88_01059 [Planctomycetes bacterium ADurb.Bin126]